jgi:hypothetical protein
MLRIALHYLWLLDTLYDLHDLAYVALSPRTIFPVQNMCTQSNIDCIDLQWLTYDDLQICIICVDVRS